jgi:hypothetical protein
MTWGKVEFRGPKGEGVYLSIRKLRRGPELFACCWFGHQRSLLLLVVSMLSCSQDMWVSCLGGNSMQ